MTMMRARLPRPHPLVLVTIAVALAGWLAATQLRQAEAAPAPGSPAAYGQDDPDLVAEGRALYRVQCSSCHGLDGGGLDAPDGAVRGPSLQNSGGAGAYYYLATGRMPLASSEEIPTRKDPAYDDHEIDALVAYVASFGDGPSIPEVDIEAGDLSEGGQLFRSNCAACHSATGAGGALSYGRAAPPLGKSEPLVVASAIRIGPGEMPSFGRNTLDEEEADSIASYVEYLREPDDRGGLALGRLGPIPEGLMVWIVGMGGLLVVCYLVGKRANERETT